MSIALLLFASPAFADSIQATAALMLTDGLARPGAYVPVTFKVTNSSGAAIEELLISSGGPVDTLVPWPLAAGDSAEKVVPIYFVAGDLRLAILPRATGGRALEPLTISPPAVRPLPDNVGLMGIPEGGPAPRPPWAEAVAKVLNLDGVRFFRGSPQALAAAMQCGMLDAYLTEGQEPQFVGRAFCLRQENAKDIAPWPAEYEWWPGAFPAGIEAPVQPEVYGLFDATPWPATDRLQLWVGLGLFALAATVLAMLVPRRRTLLAAILFVALSGIALVAIGFSGETHRAIATQARIYYVTHAQSMEAQAALEDITLLQSRGGATAIFRDERPTGVAPNALLPLPLPTLPSSEETMRTQAVLRLDEVPTLQTRRPQLVVRTIAMPVKEIFLSGTPKLSPQGLQDFVRRNAPLRAILFEGGQGTNAAGRSQTLEAWAAEWQASADPAVAYAGRSLLWWDKNRRVANGPTLLAWFVQPLPASADYGLLPAMVIFGNAAQEPPSFLSERT
jgi:hypothetical protein